MPEQQNKIKHHYVPQYYLNGFTESSSSPYFWLYRRGKQEIVRTTAKPVAYEKHFYTVTNDDGTRDSNTVENYLASQVESPANPILGKIRSRQMITDQEKEVLCHYIVVLLKRVPRHRQRVKQEIAPKTINSVAEQIYGQIEAAISEHPERSAFLEARKEEARLLFEKYERELPDTFIMSLLRHDSVRVVKTLHAMTWRFLTFDQGSAFLTSDNPVFYFEGLGIGHEYSEVTVPISSNIALWATWRQDLAEGFFQTNTQVVKELNRRTVSNASHYIFYSLKVKWILTLLSKKRHNLNRMI